MSQCVLPYYYILPSHHTLPRPSSVHYQNRTPAHHPSTPGPPFPHIVIPYQFHLPNLAGAATVPAGAALPVTTTVLVNVSVAVKLSVAVNVSVNVCVSVMSMVVGASVDEKVLEVLVEEVVLG